MRIAFIFIIIGFSIFNVGCNKDDESSPNPDCTDPTNPECPNYDPCVEETPTDANFIMLGQMGNQSPYDEIFLEDSVFFGGDVKFEAIDKSSDYYKWILGADTIEGENMHTVIRSLFIPLQPGVYKAQLHVNKSVDAMCFPDDPGIDNSERLFFFHWNICKAHIINRFKGVYENAPNDPVEIELINAFNGNEICSDINNGVIHAVNFFGQNDTLDVNRSLKGFANKKIIWDWSDDSRLIGEIYIDKSNMVHATYSKNGITRNFTGIIIK